jgi:2,4-dienoyl-CoA reductase-like NADH-dependent reductase (Old Yellow Enzyme family)
LKSLFDKTFINKVELKNRFIRSATIENMDSKNGHLADRITKLYEDLAKGGVGLIITSAAYLTGTSQIFPGQLGLYSDELIEEYSEFTSMVHKYGSKIFAQFDHTNLNGKIMGPMDLTLEDIKFIVTAFGDAAARAKKAGFDGVQIHSAHGGLFSKFLTPYYNNRNDQYGGSIDNRARIIFEAYQTIRDKVGSDYPIAIKINSEDCMDNGMSFDDCKYVCKELEKLGIDAIEISGGSELSGPNEGFARKISKNEGPYFKTYAEEIAKYINVPIILVGGNRDFEVMTNILNETSIEYFSLSRPLLRESDLIKRWQEKDLKPAKCVSCNKCLEAIGSGNEVSCIFG